MIYGHNKTIHSTKSINVELDKNGKVVAVWFRCITLPFTQHTVDDERAAMMQEMYEINRPYPLVAVEVDDSQREQYFELVEVEDE